MLERAHRIVLLSIAMAVLVIDAVGASPAVAPAFAASTFTPRQCASYGNTFSSNTIGTVFGGTAQQAVWTLEPPGQTYAGNSGCFIPSGLVRISRNT